MAVELQTHLIVIGFIWLLIKFILFPYIMDFLQLIFKNRYTFIGFVIIIGLAFYNPNYFVPLYEDILINIGKGFQWVYSYAFDFVKDSLHKLFYIN